MANKKITELPESSSVDGTELIEVVQGGVNKKSLLSVLKDYIVGLIEPFVLTGGNGTSVGGDGTSLNIGATNEIEGTASDFIYIIPTADDLFYGIGSTSASNYWSGISHIAHSVSLSAFTDAALATGVSMGGYGGAGGISGSIGVGNNRNVSGQTLSGPYIVVNDGVTANNLVRTLLTLRAASSGTNVAANGIGGKIAFQFRNNAIGDFSPVFGISYVSTDVTNGSEDAKYVISTLINGTETNILEIDQYGIKYLADYSAGWTDDHLVTKGYVDALGGGGGGGTWGSITGTLTDQTDLDTALDAKLDAASVASTGTSIAFDKTRTYGEVTPETGNITLDATGLIKGITQLVIHNHSSEPTFGAEFKVIGGEYTINETNYIFMNAVTSGLILVTISQEI